MNLHKSVNILLTVGVIVMIVSGQVGMAEARKMKSEETAQTTSASSSQTSSAPPSPSTAELNAVVAQVIPQGVPSVYGPEVGVSFSEPIKAISTLESYDRGDKKITLTGEKLDRYVKVASMTACEYCCGAKTLVFKDGSAACGCAHSAAMRGVIAYLIDKHGSEYSDAQILNEANRWKALFFPRQTVQKVLANQGQPVGNTLNQVPSQVGGC